MHEPKWFMFAGSRDASDEMLRYTQKAVDRAAKKGYMVIVGDNHKGVDMQVLVRLKEIDYDLFMVMSANDQDGRSIEFLATGKIPKRSLKREDYQKRDDELVWLAESVFLIWNGQSKGTRRAFEKAKELGKEVWLVDFGQDKLQTTYLKARDLPKETKEPAQLTLL